MIGAIAADCIGSVYEFDNTRDYDFPLLTPKSHHTDDTTLTVATMHALLAGATAPSEFANFYWKYGRAEPDQAWGDMFRQWLDSTDYKPYGSFGNGAATRVSPIGMWASSWDACTALAAASAECTHDHPDAVKSAVAVATAIWTVRNSGRLKLDRQGRISAAFGAALDAYGRGHEVFDALVYAEEEPLYVINAVRHLDETANATIPVAFAALAAGFDWESTVRFAVSAGGDSDTIGAISGALADAVYGEVPQSIWSQCVSLLPAGYRQTMLEFYVKAEERQRTTI